MLPQYPSCGFAQSLVGFRVSELKRVMKGAWLPAPSMPETQPRGSRMLRPRILGLVLLTVIGLGAGPLRAQGDGYIGIYADAAGTTPCTTVPPLSGTTLYVIAKLQGASLSAASAGLNRGATFTLRIPLVE